MAIKNLFKSKFLRKYTEIYKEDGLKGVWKEGGWRVVGIFFLFFLIKGILWLIFFYFGFEVITF